MIDAYDELYRDYALPALLYSGLYIYDPAKDIYYDRDDPHEWYDGSKVRQLRQLAKERL